MPSRSAVRHVLFVLREDHVRAERCHPLEGHVETPGPRAHAVVKVEAMKGVHDHGHPCQARRELGEQARLGVVGVNDGEALAPQGAEESDERAQVADRREAPSHGHGPMGDAARLEGRDVFAGRGDARDRVPPFAQRAQLVQQEVAEGHRARGDVGDFHRWRGSRGRHQPRSGAVPRGAARRLGQGAAEDGHVPFDHGVHVVSLAHRAAGVAGQPRADDVVSEEAIDGVGETLGITRGDEQAGPPVLYDLLHPAHPRRHHRNAGAHGLEQRGGHPLAPQGGQHREGGAGQMGPHVVGEPGGGIGVLEAARPSLGEEPTAGEVVAHEHGVDARVAIAEEAHRLQEDALSLVGRDVPDAEQRTGAFRRIGPEGKRMGVEAVRHHVHGGAARAHDRPDVDRGELRVGQVGRDQPAVEAPREPIARPVGGGALGGHDAAHPGQSAHEGPEQRAEAAEYVEDLGPILAQAAVEAMEVEGSQRLVRHARLGRGLAQARVLAGGNDDAAVQGRRMRRGHEPQHRALGAADAFGGKDERHAERAHAATSSRRSPEAKSSRRAAWTRRSKARAPASRPLWPMAAPRSTRAATEEMAEATRPGSFG